MSKMQKWVTSVTFALLFTGGLSAVGAPVITNTAAGFWPASVAEDGKITIPAITTDGTNAFDDATYQTLAKDTTFGHVSGPNKFNYEYTATNVLVNATNEYFDYTATTVKGDNWTVRQLINLSPVNDKPVFNDKFWGAPWTNQAYFAVAEDKTNDVVKLSDWVRDEETHQTNLVYSLVTPPAVGTLVASTTNGIWLYTPPANVHTVTNTFKFSVSDGSGSVEITGNIDIKSVVDKIIVQDPMIMFLEKQNGETNQTVRLSFTCADVPAGDNFNTNFAFVFQNGLQKIGTADWDAQLSTTGDVSFVVKTTNSTFNVVNFVTITALKAPFATKTITVNQAYMPKQNPEMPPLTAPELIFPSATGGAVQPPIELPDGMDQKFAITAKDMATNSWAGPAKNPLNKWGLTKIAWYVCDTNIVTAPATALFQKDDVTVVPSADGIEQFISGTFTLTKDMYKLTTEATNIWVRAIASDVAGNVATNDWRVQIKTADQQIVTVSQVYDVPVLSNVTVQASVNTANTVFEWWLGAVGGVGVNPGNLRPAQPGEDNSFATTNTPGVFKAFIGVASGFTPLWVRAAAFGKFQPSPWVRVPINVTVPLNINSLTLLENGDSTVVAGNTLSVVPAKAYYRVNDTVTLTPTVADSAAYIYNNYSAASIARFATGPNALGVATLTVPAGETSESLQITVIFKSTGAVAAPVIINPGPIQAILNQTYAGAALCAITVQASGGLYTLTASGLPTGLSLVGNNIVGKPTVAGTSEVTLTAKNAKGEGTATFTITVAPLPEWLAGTYVGPVDNSACGAAGFGAGLGTLTISADGKSTGKFIAGGKTITFRANTLTQVPGSNPVRFTIGTGLTTLGAWQQLTVTAPTFAGNNADVPVAATAVASGAGPACTANLVRQDATADADVKSFDGYYTLSLPSGVDYGSGYLTLTVKDGNAKVAGKLADGTAVSFKTTLIKRVVVGPLEQVVTELYVAPSKYVGGSFAGLIEFAVSADGKKIVRVPAGNAGFAWVNYDRKSTAIYGVAMNRVIAVVQGGLYSSVATVANYYVDGVLAPDLDFSQSVTDYNPEGKKVKTPVPEQAQSALFTDSGLQVTPNGLAIPASTFTFTAKVDTPKQDKTTKEYLYIDNTGDGVYNNSALKVSLIKSGTYTGVFKGSFVTYYDYVSAVDMTTNKETPKHMAKTSRFEGVLVPVREEAAYAEGAGFFLWSRKVIVSPGTGGYPGSTDYIYNFNESYDFRLVK